MVNTPWHKQLQRLLVSNIGEKKAHLLYEKYAQGLPASYSDENPPEIAAEDLFYLEKLSEKNPLEINFYKLKQKVPHPLHLRLFQWNLPIPLSDILPMLENLDLRTYSEHPHKITLSEQTVWISDFIVSYKNDTLEVNKISALFQEAFTKIYLGRVENDGFNKLILGASLSWREITILRAYVKYLRQIGFHFSQPYIEKTLTAHPETAKNLVALFLCLHDPKKKNGSKQQAQHIEHQINQALESIPSLDEDCILRRVLALIKASLRTNYFQTIDHQLKEYLAIKLDSQKIPELPLPQPLYEIFVYSPRFEAIHLRHSKVARGGIRWSDRLEDFRTEILGLMKAQKVKNAIIVPSGAKGGFVLKNTGTLSRDELQKEVIHCYQAFISGLLDLTDNIVVNKIVSPKNIMCYDGADPYLVVAADKGTATFSDIANELAKKYNFWLGDAFASGGATGYDHKKMGITARGAWESVKRHFRELEIDIVRASIQVIGIGDMSGDVFGNGMIYSKNIKLVGAFNHRHIFLDPKPHPDISYQERLRLFHLPISSWEDYNPKLISKGGGVFNRQNKSIAISYEVKQLLKINDDTLTPNELIQAMLKAPVDLLFNGGIGTYVKASSEHDVDVHDRSNDYCRVNGNELRCKIVAEGGNLGFTQLGRIEYAINGGLINADFIDNSAGVDCSDHEVNLKILLDQELRKKTLSLIKRNQLLTSVTQEVADLVLKDNYQQAFVMSFSAYHAKKMIGLHQSYLKELENQGVLDREVEYLPSDKNLLERKAAGEGLTRPELAVLLAYTKIYLKHEILKSNLFDDDYLVRIVTTAFPETIRKKYQQDMNSHRLHRDIIATQLGNQIVNEMGITFVYRIQMETGANTEEIIRAYFVASHIFNSEEMYKTVEKLAFKIPMSEQYEIFYNFRHLINLATRWFLHGNHLKDHLEQIINHFSPQIKILEKEIPNLMGGLTKSYLESLTDKFLQAGLPTDIAHRIAIYRAIYTSLNIIDVATKYDFDLLKTARVYFAAGERVNLLWFRDQIANDSREGHWNTLARLTLRDELDIAQRMLTIAIMQFDRKEKAVEKLIHQWMTHHHRAMSRWDKLLTSLHESTNIEYTMFFIALRELIGLVGMPLV